MIGKLEVVIMLVLMKDEKKYFDCVDVMDMFEDWVYEIYIKVFGVVGINVFLLLFGRLVIYVLLWFDQFGFYVFFVLDFVELFCGVKVLCIGDQLMRVRFVGVKDFCVGVYIFKDRLDYLYLFCCVVWYIKRSFFKVYFEIIYCGKYCNMIVLKF